MQRFFLTLRNIVWSSVLAVVLSVLSIACAFVGSVSLTISFGLSAVVAAILSQRA